jgi:hypothetical protein
MVIDLSSKEATWSFSAAQTAIAVVQRAIATAETGISAAEGREQSPAFGSSTSSRPGLRRQGARQGRRGWGSTARAGAQLSNELSNNLSRPHLLRGGLRAWSGAGRT